MLICICFREKYVDSTEVYSPVDLGVGFPDYGAAASYIPSVLADVAISPDNTIHQYNRGFVTILLNSFKINIILQCLIST